MTNAIDSLLVRSQHHAEKIEEVAQATNGLKNELVAATKEIAHAEGMAIDGVPAGIR